MCGTRLLYAPGTTVPQSSGEKRRVTCSSSARTWLRAVGLMLSQADGWLTVKASSPAAAGHGVRPSATRHALVGLRRREGIALPACTEPRQTGSPAVTVQRVVCGARSRWLNVQSGRRYAHLCWRVNRRCDTKRTSEKDEA